MKDLHLFSGILGIFIFAYIFNLIFGQVNLGAHTIGHNDNLWNMLGLFVVGLGSCLIGGCPFRQMILAGSGNTDSGLSVFGMIVGAALSHNFGMVSGKGATIYAKFGVTTAIIFLFILGFSNILSKK
jgi:YedE family putative selenium metabolism protein